MPYTRGYFYEKSSLENVFDLQKVGLKYTNRGLKWRGYGNQRIRMKFLQEITVESKNLSNVLNKW